MVGITLKQYWGDAEKALHTLHERLISEGAAECPYYLKYRQIMIDMIAIGKVIEDLGLFSGLKAKGEELEKKPSEFGLDKLPEPDASYAAREFAKVYCEHLKYFVETSFNSSNRLINLALPGQKPTLEKLIVALEFKIGSTGFLQEEPSSSQPMEPDDLDLKRQDELKPLPADEFESIEPRKEFNLSHNLCTKLLKAYHFFNDFKSILNGYLLKSRLTRIQPSYEEITNESTDIQLVLRIKEIESFLNICGQGDRVLTAEDINSFKIFKLLHTILLKLKEYEALISPQPDPYCWQDFLSDYENTLRRLISDIGDQLIGLSELPEKSQNLSSMITDLNSKLITYSLDDHIIYLKQQAKEWAEKSNQALELQLKLLLDGFEQLDLNDEKSSSDKSSGGLLTYIWNLMPSWSGVPVSNNSNTHGPDPHVIPSPNSGRGCP